MSGLQDSDEGRPAVSVIVPAHDEERWIGECLDSLRRQTYPDFEVVVVDDGSSDRTGAIARRSDATVIRTDQRGAGAAKNAGAVVSRGRILVFLDADEMFDPDFLERLVAPLANPDVRATFPGGVRYRNSDQGLAPGWLYVRGIVDRRPPRFETPHRIPKAMRRDEFFAAGRYPEVGYGEDELLGERLGPAAVVDDATWEFTLPTGVREIFGKARWIGRGPQFAGRRPALWRLSPPVSIAAALGLLRARQPRSAAVRLIYDAGLIVGFLESRVRPDVRHHA